MWTLEANNNLINSQSHSLFNSIPNSRSTQRNEQLPVFLQRLLDDSKVYNTTWKCHISLELHKHKIIVHLSQPKLYFKKPLNLFPNKLIIMNNFTSLPEKSSGTQFFQKHELSLLPKLFLQDHLIAIVD